MPDLQTLVDTVRRDGYVVVRDFLPPDVVARAHAELEDWFRKDVEDRQARGVTSAPYAGPAGRSVLTRPSHLLLDRDLIAPYETDWTGRFTGTAAAVVRPAGTEVRSEADRTSTLEVVCCPGRTRWKRWPPAELPLT